MKGTNLIYAIDNIITSAIIFIVHFILLLTLVWDIFVLFSCFYSTTFLC